MNPLIDTNIISELVRPQPDHKVVKWAGQQTGFFLSVISLEEIHYGLSWKPNERVNVWITNFLTSYCQLLSVTDTIAKQAGELRGRLQQQGRTRTQADIVIAATSLEHGLTLVTRNEKDFEDCGLKLLNPFEA